MVPKRKPLNRPPYAHNWVRYNYLDCQKMAKAMAAFEMNRPQVTYLAGQKIISDIILLGLAEATALNAALTKGHTKSRPYVHEYVRAFLDHQESLGIKGLPAYDEFVQPFRVNRDISIPVKPLVVVSDKGVLRPLFIVGWSSMPLDIFQRRLLMTVLEDAVFTLEDFKNSPGLFLSFPREGMGEEAVRNPEVWNRGDYESLSKSELSDQLDNYLIALEKARKIVSENQRAQKKAPAPSEELPLGPTLFDWETE